MPTSVPPNFVSGHTSAMTATFPTLSQVNAAENVVSNAPIPVQQINNANCSTGLEKKALSDVGIDISSPKIDASKKIETNALGRSTSRSSRVQNLEVIEISSELDEVEEQPKNLRNGDIDSSDDEQATMLASEAPPLEKETKAEVVDLGHQQLKQDGLLSNCGNKIGTTLTLNENGLVPTGNADPDKVTTNPPRPNDASLPASVSAPITLHDVPSTLVPKRDATSFTVFNCHPPEKKVKLDSPPLPIQIGNCANDVASTEVLPIRISSPPTMNSHDNSVPTTNVAENTFKVSPSSDQKNSVDRSHKLLCDPVFASYVKLDPIPDVPALTKLNQREITELERILQFGEKFNNALDDGWRDDWSGNLQLIDKDIVTNLDQLKKMPHIKSITEPFRDVVAEKARNGSAEAFRGIKLLFSYVYHMKGTPDMAKKIMAYALFRPARTVKERMEYIHEAIRRISYDPIVLRQDGWTTVQADRPDGASGGAYLIGRRVIWSRYEAIVIAFVRDEEIGDLWKAMWIEDLDTFDLEADELQEALKKFENREDRKKKRMVAKGVAKPLSGGSPARMIGYLPKPTKPSASSRFAATKDFTLEGIEHGIILATTFHPNSRSGVMWPARVMHVSEIKALGSAAPTSKRSSQKNQIPVIFLAPYWNGKFLSKGKSEYNPNAPVAKSAFSTGPLFEMDCIEVSNSTIEKYPYDGSSQTLSIDQLRTSFRFLGLPKTAFQRYLDSHRLAHALKTFAHRQLSKSSSGRSDGSHADAFAALTDSHTLSVKAAIYPQSVLNLPYDYILAELPTPCEKASQLAGEDGEEATEPVLQLHHILKAMTPPLCWGMKPNEKNEDAIVKTDTSPPNTTLTTFATPSSARRLTPVNSPEPRSSVSASTTNGSGGNVNHTPWAVKHFASKYLLDIIGDGESKDDSSNCNLTSFSGLGSHLANLVSRLNRYLSSLEGKRIHERSEMLENFCDHCLITKSHGEDAIYSKDLPPELNPKNLVLQWQKACEKVYKCASAESALPGFGNCVTAVISDSRCNQHLTATGSYERAVRLPAAIRGAKMAGAGSSVNVSLITTVEDSYMDLAEKNILPKAHKASYLKRMKAKIAALPPDVRGAPLTDDSEGEGGEDTMGSRGSFTAAVAGVATALRAVDMVIGGECVNVFCAIRPPGHHAGWDLRAMNAISNGFCVLNAVACAALYAVTPQSEGGRGLKRVCVIDFDVHHGNGTQEILCSTHDSRFLYVSTHAGGAHINGFEDEGDLESASNDDGLRRIGGRHQEGIFPGRCGDTSPHKGVLNIPLGQKVTASAIGNALVTLVAPAVESFSPELIILSAGFDAHKNDPLGMGGLTAEDFGSVTEVACQMAAKSCSGRVISLLEGGYGVPCCRTRNDLFLPTSFRSDTMNKQSANGMQVSYKQLDLGDDIPEGMSDEVPLQLQQKLDRCHQEGFLHCIKEHVAALARSNKRVGYGKK